MSGTLAPSGVKLRTHSYHNFQGIDSSRDKTSLDTGDQQHLVSCVNAYCDWRGGIVRDNGAVKRATTIGTVRHLAFYGRDLAIWAETQDSGTALKAESGVQLQDIYDIDAVVNSTVFGGETIFASRGYPLEYFNGTEFHRSNSLSTQDPAYLITIQNRLVIAGGEGSDTKIKVSRVDDSSVFPEDEEDGAAQVTKAIYFDIGNVIGSQGSIKGLGKFENSRLVIFTEDQGVVYEMSTDNTKIAIDDSIIINAGTISHNTIREVGDGVFFCARDGVYRLMRSSTNGITANIEPMSAKVSRLYKQLINQVANPEDISAHYDQDEHQYHVYFPRSDSLCTRLTLTLSPDDESEENKWSTGDFMNVQCAASLGGVTLFGNRGQIWESRFSHTDDDIEEYPEAVVTTPIFWHGTMTEMKQSHSMLIQAIGEGEIEVEVYDDTGRQLSVHKFQIQDALVDGEFPDVPLNRQFNRKLEHRYRGIQLRIKIKGKGLIQILGVAINVKK
jgi:hypothetical protein